MPRASWVCTTCNVERTENLSRVCSLCLGKSEPKPKRIRKKREVQEELPSIRIYKTPRFT